MVAFKCVVVGDRFISGCTDTGVDPNGWNAHFIDKYKIVVPNGGSANSVIQEVNNTKVWVSEIGDTSATPTAGNQDGGNGSGGDTSGAQNHKLAAVKTHADMSFWKIELSKKKVLNVDSQDSLKSLVAVEPARIRSEDVNIAYRQNRAPGCVFSFDSVDAAYRWLTAPGKRGGAAIHGVYEEVRIIGINSHNPQIE
jgi:hypothetical protein